MTKYLSSEAFSVHMAGNKAYRDNFDAIDWRRKPEDKFEPPEMGPGDIPEWQSIQDQVREFHEAYGLPVNPGTVSHSRIQLRLKLVAEEFFELLGAFGIWPTCMCGGSVSDIIDKFIETDLGGREGTEIDIIAAADALADIAYVVEGANLEFGLDSARVLAEVHRSNMSKLGEDGKPIYREDGKVVKGPNYSPPDIKNALGF